MSGPKPGSETIVKDMVGLVIAGGQGTRLGQAKHTVDLNGQSLINIVADRLAVQTAGTAVNLPGGAQYGCYPVVNDAVSQQGPLAAVSGGLAWAKTAGSRYLVTMPVDVPFFPLDFVQQMIASRNEHVPCFAFTERAHGLCAVWPVAVQHKFNDAFTGQGVRAVQHMHDILGSQPVMFPCATPDPFMNINTEADLKAARLLADQRTA